MTSDAAPRPLTYVCDWLPPDFGAVGQYSEMFARDYAKKGRAVVLIGLSSAGASRSVETVGQGTLTTVRLHASDLPRARLWRRLLWTMRTNLRLTARVVAETPRGGEVLFTGSPPFMIFPLSPLRWVFGYRLTYRITDFHPECLMATMDRAPMTLRIFHSLTVALRRRVDRFEVLGEDQRRLLARIGIAGERVVTKRDPSPVEIPPGTKPLPEPADAEGRALLLYSGNYGVAHEVDTFVEGYIRHHREGSGRVVLWLNAVGSSVETILDRLRAADCPVIPGRPVPLAELAALLVTPSAHLITLKDPFVGLVLPSKVPSTSSRVSSGGFGQWGAAICRCADRRGVLKPAQQAGVGHGPTGHAGVGGGASAARRLSCSRQR